MRACLWICLALLAAPSARGGEAVVVVANASQPASLELARHYLSARNLPTNNLCALDLPAGEVISRGLYEQRLRDPLLAWLRGRGLMRQVKRTSPPAPHQPEWNTVANEVRYIVCMYGVPVRIADTRFRLERKVASLLGAPQTRDEAAVDSELALLAGEPYDIRGYLANPAHGLVQWDDLGALQDRLIIAARLDGPDPATVHRMIDDAQAAERTGLTGRCYFDSRGLTGAGYAVGDFWIEEAAERMRREGYEVVLDRHEGIWSDRFPMEDVGVYFGWYAEHAQGPFLRPGFRFRRGAVAYHLHSTSAAELRTGTRYWAGPLLAAGAAATLGAVAEPYLPNTPNLQILADRLCRGRTFGESALLAQRVLSWQITVVGDPLYRPFRLGLDEALRQAPADAEEAEWAWVRAVNRLAADGRLNPALAFGREKLASRDSLPLRERLAQLYAANNLLDDAEQQYRHVLDHARTPETAARVWLAYAQLLQYRRKPQVLAAVQAQLLEKWKGSPYQELLKAMPTAPTGAPAAPARSPE